MVIVHIVTTPVLVSALVQVREVLHPSVHVVDTRLVLGIGSSGHYNLVIKLNAATQTEIWIIYICSSCRAGAMA